MLEAGDSMLQHMERRVTADCFMWNGRSALAATLVTSGLAYVRVFAHGFLSCVAEAANATSVESFYMQSCTTGKRAKTDCPEYRR